MYILVSYKLQRVVLVEVIIDTAGYRHDTGHYKMNICELLSVYRDSLHGKSIALFWFIELNWINSLTSANWCFFVIIL